MGLRRLLKVHDDALELPDDWQSYRDQLLLRQPAKLLSFLQQTREAFE
jgi:hypothetical protein